MWDEGGVLQEAVRQVAFAPRTALQRSTPGEILEVDRQVAFAPRPAPPPSIPRWEMLDADRRVAFAPRPAPPPSIPQREALQRVPITAQDAAATCRGVGRNTSQVAFALRAGIPLSILVVDSATRTSCPSKT